MDMNNLYGSAMIQYILAKMKKWSYFQFGLGDLAELNTLHIISFRWVNLPKDNLIQLFLKSNRGGTQFLTNEKMVTTSNWVGGFGWILHSTFALLSLTLCTKEFLNSLIHLRVTEQTIFFWLKRTNGHNLNLGRAIWMIFSLCTSSYWDAQMY